jgi:hypothetical protein
MALKDLIASPGETAAYRVLKEWRIAGDARAELTEAIKQEVEHAIAKEREACAQVARAVHAVAKPGAWNGWFACEEIEKRIRARSEQ